MATNEPPRQHGDAPHRDLHPSLESYFASLLARHREAAAKIEWSYHQFLPVEALRANAVERAPLSPTAYMAVETALLTEVNLPWYTASLSQGLSGCPGPIQEFVRLWTSEEDQHAMLLESYLLLTGSGDPSARARLRKGMIAVGWRHALGGPFEGMVYTGPTWPRAVSSVCPTTSTRSCSRCGPTGRSIAAPRRTRRRGRLMPSCAAIARRCIDSRGASVSFPGSPGSAKR